MLKSTIALGFVVTALSALSLVSDNSSAIAATFKVSGQFGNISGGPPNILTTALVNGSFDGTYDVIGLPVATNGSVNVPQFLVNLRNSVGVIIKTYSNANSGNGAFIGNVHSRGVDVLAFQDNSNSNNTSGLQLGFPTGFIGEGTTNSNVPFTAFIANQPTGSTFLEVTSATSTAIPTPALLPGLIGLGAAALRKRHQQKVEACG